MRTASCDLGSTAKLAKVKARFGGEFLFPVGFGTLREICSGTRRGGKVLVDLNALAL